MSNIKTIVPDTSVVLNQLLFNYINDSDHRLKVVIPEAVLTEVEQKIKNGVYGERVISDLQRIITLEQNGDIESVKYSDLVSSFNNWSDIKSVLDNHNATLLTSDSVVYELSKVGGFDSKFIQPREKDELKIESFFTDKHLSVHLKAGEKPKAKTGTVDDVQFVEIGDSVLSTTDVEEIAIEIERREERNSDTRSELTGEGLNIIQYDDYRIAITRPPFSEAIEITAVRPAVTTELKEYTFSEEIQERFIHDKRGILIAGEPGAGKSTFAQAVGEYLDEEDYVVKTMEKPRDLQVNSNITQYTALDGDMEKTADSLLLVRPDYTIYDEVRKTSDFDVFADMRLAGVGMVGVTHATEAIDAVNRMVGRVELGLIPQIIDTVLFIEGGDITTIYDIQTNVKTPEGMDSEELTRPVIEVTNVETGQKEYEIYTFNGQAVTVPVNNFGSIPEIPKEVKNSDRPTLNTIKHQIKSVATGHVAVEILSNTEANVYVEEKDIPRVIGKNGTQISNIEKNLGMNLNIESH